ncbi:MAG TPA: VWA domain-containing protein [Thermoanaerobaculia bacterium]|nr:VWA domain-containing protein [Thermoanaerobaculia bacterium]
MTGNRRAAALLLAIALAAGAPAPSFAQAGAEEVPEELFTETLDVQVVNLEVRVTDRRGRPIHGLTRDDFELYEDGRRIELSHFAEYQGGREAGAGTEAAAESPAPPEAVPGEGPAASSRPTADALRHFVLFFDLDHLGPAGLRRVLPDLQGFVEEVLGPGDRVMVVVRQDNLRVVQELTGDRELVAAALEGIARIPPRAIQGATERRQALRAVRFALEQSPPGDQCTETESYLAEQAVRQHAGEIRSQVEGTLSALTSLVRALVGLPGPKVVIYAGEGLEQRPAIDLYQLLIEVCPVRERDLQMNLFGEDLSSSFQRLTADANANRVTFYTLDAGGLRADGSAEDADPHVRLSTLGQRMRTANLQHSLFLMADETGGQAIFNTNRFAEELAEVALDVETYYSLGFVPDHQGDGRVHRLRVKVLPDHHEARYRVAYRDKPLEERIVESMLGTLLFGVEDNPLGVELEIGEAAPGGEGLLKVPVRIRVPLRRVVATPGAGFSAGRLRLVLVALDPEGKWTPVRQQEAFFKLPEGQDPAASARLFEVAIELPPGENVVAVGVRDDLGGETSYLRQRIELALPGSARTDD